MTAIGEDVGDGEALGADKAPVGGIFICGELMMEMFAGARKRAYITADNSAASATNATIIAIRVVETRHLG